MSATAMARIEAEVGRQSAERKHLVEVFETVFRNAAGDVVAKHMGTQIRR